MGETRKKELVKSGMTLGLRNEDDVFVIDNKCVNFQRQLGIVLTPRRKDFPDSMTTVWEHQKIADLLSGAFASHPSTEDDDSSGYTANIDVLITFDAHGISSHPNHISLYHGCRTFVAALSSPVDLYTLTTVNFFRKYASFLDAFATLLLAWRSVGVSEKQAGEDAHPASLVFLSSFTGDKSHATAWKAMTEAHKSQMVWFRYGWITLSRYMVINDLHLENIEK